MSQQPITGRHQLQQLVADLTEGVLFVETDGQISWANEAALELISAHSPT